MGVKRVEDYDFTRLVPKKTTRWDTMGYSSVRAFSLLVKKPVGARMGFYRVQVPGMIDLYKEYGDDLGQRVIRYIILVYDIKSKFRVTEPLLGRRKEVVLDEVEIKDDDFRERCVTLGDVAIAEGVADYLRFQDDRTWRLIVQHEESFDSNEKEIMLAMTSDKDKDRFLAADYKGKLLRLQRELDDVLQDLYARFTGDDAYATVEVKRMLFNPERVALALDEEEE